MPPRKSAWVPVRGRPATVFLGLVVGEARCSRDARLALTGRSGGVLAVLRPVGAVAVAGDVTAAGLGVAGVGDRLVGEAQSLGAQEHRGVELTVLGVGNGHTHVHLLPGVTEAWQGRAEV